MQINHSDIDDESSIHDPDDPEPLVPNSPTHQNRIPDAGSSSTDGPIGQLVNSGASMPPASALSLWQRLFSMTNFSSQNDLTVGNGAPSPTSTHPQIATSTQRTVYIHRGLAKQRNQIEERVRQVHLNVVKVQLGVWYRQTNTSPHQARKFSVEYERDFLRNGAAFIHLVNKHGLICIDMLGRANKASNCSISVKFSIIRDLGIGYDETEKPFILFDLYVPPSFEVQGTHNRAPDGTRHRWTSKPRDRLSALDDAHARIAPYAHQLRILLANRDDLSKFEKICHISQGSIQPVRVSRMDAAPQDFFSNRYIHDVYRWIKTMDWKSAFQIEGYLRRSLLNPHDLLFALQKPFERVISNYRDDASEVLRLFSVALCTRNVDETPSACLTRVLTGHPMKVFKSLRAPPGRFLCHHVVITPTRILLEGPFVTPSNRVIRHYQDHDPALSERFVRVEFREEDNLRYRWDGDVDLTWFVRHRVGGILRDGFELGGREFEFLAYSMSSLHGHAVWFVAPFRDPIEGYVNAERIRTSLGDLSDLRRMPSKYAARMAQAFTSTEPSVTIRRDQWEEQDDLGPHTDGVGTISPELADMIWDKNCRASGNLRENRVKPSAYQFRFLGYKGVLVVDHRLKGIKMRLRSSQRTFYVHDVEVAELEIVRPFCHPEAAHLNRPLIMLLEALGVDAGTIVDLQDAMKAQVYAAGNSLEDFTNHLRGYSIGRSFYLPFILDRLSKLGLGLRDTFEKRAFGNAFLGRLLHSSTHHILREMKYRARIPVPKSYRLVGVADEGQGYIKEGADPDKVFTLKEGFIYACVQEAVDTEPVFLEGPCLISRSPAFHPGDVQRVYAVGKPPEDSICFFRDLKNVVVLSAVGNRSFASCLGGGDLDGDTYDIYFGTALLRILREAPPSYPPSEVWTLGEDLGDASVDNIRDFIVEFITSDLMSYLAHNHMVIADQSADGVFDGRCIKLAKLCRIAIDYAKNGKAVEINDMTLKPFNKLRPDWSRPEVPGTRQVDYYESRRALGHLFRNINLHSPNELLDRIPMTHLEEIAPLEDAISRTLAPLIQSALNGSLESLQTENVRTADLHIRYASEMRFICVTHSIAISPDVHLSEEEVVLGITLGKRSQQLSRTDRGERMRMQAEMLVRDLRAQIVPIDAPLVEEDLRRGLRDAWGVWCWAQHRREKPFIQSFSLVALGLVLDVLEQLGALLGY